MYMITIYIYKSSYLYITIYITLPYIANMAVCNLPDIAYMAVEIQDSVEVYLEGSNFIGKK